MTKKANKLSIRLDPGEACVVLPVEYWHHIIDLYKTYALEAPSGEEAQLWMDVSNAIQQSVDETLVPLFEEDEWN